MAIRHYFLLFLFGVCACFLRADLNAFLMMSEITASTNTAATAIELAKSHTFTSLSAVLSSVSSSSSSTGSVATATFAREKSTYVSNVLSC